MRLDEWSALKFTLLGRFVGFALVRSRREGFGEGLEASGMARGERWSSSDESLFCRRGSGGCRCGDVDMLRGGVVLCAGMSSVDEEK